MNKLLEVAESIAAETSGTSPAAYRRRLLSRPGIAEAAKAVAMLMHHTREGSKRAAFELNEALTTSDLAQFASGMLIDREMLANYESLPTQWPKFLTPTSLKDFKPKYMSELVLGAQVFKDVPERTAYPMAQGPRLAEYPIQGKKTGLLWGFSFEAQVNDDLEQLMMVPNAMPQMAVDTEDDRGLRLLINLETGALNTAFFSVANGNIGTLELNAENLQTVLVSLRTKRDPDKGTLIPAGRLQLVVGPALEAQAERILNVDRIQVSDGNGGFTYEPNPLRGKVDLVVNDKQVGESWIVMPKPGTAVRAPFWFGRVRGYEQPDFRYKADQGRAIGGGDIVVNDGSFDDDTIWYRGRHIMGVAHGDPTLTYGSDNSGD
jgi:Mu-like prophage major head subunit gpT